MNRYMERNTMISINASYSLLCEKEGKAYIFIINHTLNVNMNVVQSCPTLCDHMDYTAHGILQARILEWVAFSISRGSSQPRDQTQVYHSAGRFFTSWVTREAQEEWVAYPFPSGSSWSRNWTWLSCIAGRFFTTWATRESSNEP